VLGHPRPHALACGLEAAQDPRLVGASVLRSTSFETTAADGRVRARD